MEAVHPLLRDATEFVRQSRDAEALPLLDRLLAETPDDVEGLRLKAQLLTNRGRYDEADALLMRAESIGEPDEHVCATRLQWFMKRDRFDEALAHAVAMSESIGNSVFRHLEILLIVTNPFVFGDDEAERRREERERKLLVAWREKFPSDAHVEEKEISNLLHRDRRPKAADLAEATSRAEALLEQDPEDHRRLELALEAAITSDNIERMRELYQRARKLGVATERQNEKIRSWFTPSDIMDFFGARRARRVNLIVLALALVPILALLLARYTDAPRAVLANLILIATLSPAWLLAAPAYQLWQLKRDPVFSELYKASDALRLRWLLLLPTEAIGLVLIGRLMRPWIHEPRLWLLSVLPLGFGLLVIGLFGGDMLSGKRTNQIGLVVSCFAILIAVTSLFNL